MGSVSVCGPNSNSIWKSACSPSRKPTPILESVPVARIVRPISRNCSSRVDSVRTGRAQARLEKAKHARPVKVPRAFASRDKTFFFFFFSCVSKHWILPWYFGKLWHGQLHVYLFYAITGVTFLYWWDIGVDERKYGGQFLRNNETRCVWKPVTTTLSHNCFLHPILAIQLFYKDLFISTVSLVKMFLRQSSGLWSRMFATFGAIRRK